MAVELAVWRGEARVQLGWGAVAHPPNRRAGHQTAHLQGTLKGGPVSSNRD